MVEKLSVGRTSYVLLRRVQHPTSGFASLTARERDAARLASTGASIKEVGHQMGISDSTVRVLLLRASRKLGAVDRADLIHKLRTRGT